VTLESARAIANPIANASALTRATILGTLCILNIFVVFDDGLSGCLLFEDFCKKETYLFFKSAVVTSRAIEYFKIRKQNSFFGFFFEKKCRKQESE